MTLPNWITLVRILLIPVFAWYAVQYGLSVEAGAPLEPLRYAAVAVFLTAACTDGLDGYIARHYNLRSRLGSVLDPLAGSCSPPSSR
jgi:cardiolipin synthase (CMP-forming)